MTSKRTGVILLEAAAGGALLAVLVVILLRVLGAAALERRAVERRAIALQVAAGAVERATALEWNEIDAERLAEIRLSEGVSQILPGATLTWAVEPVQATPKAKHIQAEVAWRSPTGAAGAPVRLHYWAYAPEQTASGTVPGASP